MDNSISANAKLFFDACETGKGWDACSAFCQENATFSAQSEPLVEIKDLKTYTEWMKGLANITMPECKYDIKSWTSNETQVVGYAVFSGTHTGEGGPVAATGKSTVSDYVYVMNFDNGKINHMTKIWNAPWAMRELGWM